MKLALRPCLAVFLVLVAGLPSAAAPEDFLPAAEYDPDVPAPASVLGWEVGEWHVRHDQIVRYAEVLAEASDRVTLEIQGYSHEDRPQPLLIVTAPENHARLEDVLAAHRARSEAPFPTNGDGPVVVWLGYSIHGDEASGANAALLVAYHLAAARGDEVEGLLRETVVLIDPSLNPDGLARFAQWANMHRGEVLVADREHREHVQGWPSGRTNHYWFDLNRDWLPARHPESRARVATLQRWRPNLLADFHEMGSDATYFFQPGVPSRQNPLTPAANLRLTREIARYHARAFDAAGRLYYTEETFDDFYYGKGSTYPDVQGAVGILFEQASARGHLTETDNGPLSFRETIQGQVLTSFSALRAAREKRRELLDYQASFYRDGAAEAARDPVAGWVVGDGGDPVRAHTFVELLLLHGVEVHALAERLSAGGTTFEPGSAWLVPAAQRQARLARALFERRTDFVDNTFYDVSAWTLPLAFDLPTGTLPRERFAERYLGPPVTATEAVVGRAPVVEAPFAWLFEWSGHLAPRALYRLLDAGVVARVATRPFEAETDAGRRSFGYGTLVVPRGLQTLSGDRLAELMTRVAAENGVDVYAVESGLTPVGVDLGSPSLEPVRLPRPLLVVGDGVSAYEAGEMWHLLDQRWRIALPLVERDRLGEVNLADHTHLILVDGGWGDLEDGVVAELRHWLRAGGTVVATQGAALWADALLAEDGEGEEAEDGEPLPEETRAVQERATERGGQASTTGGARPVYAEFEQRHAEGLIGGAIFLAELDVTHPLAFGFSDARLPVFRDGTRPLEPSENPFENVALFGSEPLLAGYASEANVEALAGTAAVIAGRVGRGVLVRLADDPAFRAFWYGTERLVANALFFGPAVKRTGPVE